MLWGVFCDWLLHDSPVEYNRNSCSLYSHRLILRSLFNTRLNIFCWMSFCVLLESIHVFLEGLTLFAWCFSHGMRLVLILVLSPGGCIENVAGYILRTWDYCTVKCSIVKINTAVGDFCTSKTKVPKHLPVKRYFTDLKHVTNCMNPTIPLEYHCLS